MKYDKIYLDVDGVLFQSCEAIAQMLNEMQGTNFNGSDVISWNFKEICPDLTNDQVEELFSDITFFQIVDFVKGAREFLEKYHNKITIITKGTDENIEMKKIWFKNEGFSDISLIGLNLNQSKNNVNMINGIFVDDSASNLNEVTTAKEKVMFCEYNDDKIRDWQVGWNGKKIYSFKELENLIK